MTNQTIDLAVVANSTPASKTIFKALSGLQRARRRTDLGRLYRMVHHMDNTVTEKDFLDIFKSLQDAKVGSLIIGRKNNPNRFAWRYNLKDIAARLQGVKETGPLALLPEVKAKRRKKQNQEIIPINTISKSLEGASIQLSISLPIGTPLKEVQALIDLAKSLQK